MTAEMIASAPRLLVAAASLSLLAFACSSSSGGASGSSGTSSGGSSGSSGASSSGASGGGPALPATTFLYVSRETSDHDVLVAWDVATNTKTVVTDLTSDGSQGWQIAGFGVSPDRTRIVLASLYGGTKEDVANRLAANRIWSLSTDGKDWKRLTPVWENKSGGRTSWNVEVRNPVFSADGATVLFNYGEYWYEGTKLQGGSAVWSVPSDASSLPTLPWAIPGCSVTSPSADPKTGRIVVNHSVCTDSGNEGLWLYTLDGSAPPEQLVKYGAIDPALEPVAWAKDGSGFVFVGTIGKQVNGTTVSKRSVLAFDLASKNVVEIAVPTDPNAAVRDATLAPDASAVVYCLATDVPSGGQTLDLHLVDVTANPPTDTALTNDGKSCSPRW